MVARYTATPASLGIGPGVTNGTLILFLQVRLRGRDLGGAHLLMAEVSEVPVRCVVAVTVMR